MRNVSPKLGPWFDSFNQLLANIVKKGFKPTPMFTYRLTSSNSGKNKKTDAK